jgi:hypothetical protein
MLTCLTNEDALRLVRKTTLKSLLTQLMGALKNKPGKLDISEQHEQWSCVSSLHHQLSRSFNGRGECSYWALWSDFTSMHPLFMASWYWWQPMLQGALNAQALPQVRSQSLSLVDCDTDQIWTVLAAVHTRGVDELVISDESAWRPLLDPLPVAVQAVDNPDSLRLTVCPRGPAATPTDWYVLFRLLYRLSDELCTGHRVDFNQQLQRADQALDRLLTY